MIGLFGKDLLRYLPGEAVLVTLSLISVPIFTRILAPEQFGQYTLVMSAVIVAVRLFGALPMGLVRFYPAAKDEDLHILVRSSVWTQVFASLVMTLGFLIVVRLIWPGNGTLQWLFAAGTSIMALQTTFIVLEDILRAGRRVKAYNVFRICSKTTGFAAGVLLAVYFDLGVLGMLWGIALGFATTLPFLWVRAFVGIPAIGRMSFAPVRKVVAFGTPLVIGNLGAWVLTYFDRYLIQLFFGAEAVGLYSAAYAISEHSITLLAGLFMLSSTPLLTQVWERQGREAAGVLLASVTRLYLLVSIPAAVGLSALAEPAMSVLTGPEFSRGYEIVPWIVAGAFFVGLQHRFNQVLKLLNRTRDIMIWIVVSGVLNIALNWWLLTWFGYTAAAVNTLICYLVLCAGQAWASRRHYRWPFPWRTLFEADWPLGLCMPALYF